MSLGLFFAALTIFLFGSWAVPTKTLQIEPKVQAFWLTVGHLLFAVVVFIATSSPLPASATLWPLIAGIIWGIGMIAGFVAIKQIGITRALGIWSPTVIVVGALWGLLYFGELWTLGRDRLLLTGVSICLVIIAAVLVILSKEDSTQLKNAKIGVLSALCLGVFHGSYFVPLYSSKFSIFTTFIPLSVGMVLVTFAVVRVKKGAFFSDPLSLFRMLVAGMILCSGNYTALLTLKYLGVSLGYPLTQFGIVVNTLWGTLLFKEVVTKRGYAFVSIGVAITIVGAILLNFARFSG
jgi:glucose uptake protein